MVRSYAHQTNIPSYFLRDLGAPLSFLCCLSAGEYMALYYKTTKVLQTHFLNTSCTFFVFNHIEILICESKEPRYKKFISFSNFCHHVMWSFMYFIPCHSLTELELYFCLFLGLLFYIYTLLFY